MAKQKETYSITEQFSSKLSDCMDLMGYSYRMVRNRQRMNIHMDCLYNTNEEYSHQTVITTGGKGEGTAKYFESDIDRMYTLEGVVCVKKDDVMYFKMDRKSNTENSNICHFSVGDNQLRNDYGFHSGKDCKSNGENDNLEGAKALVQENIRYPDHKREFNTRNYAAILSKQQSKTDTYSCYLGQRLPGNRDESMTVFEVFTEGCSPGYTRLRLKQLSPGSYTYCIEEALSSFPDGVFIANSFPQFEKARVQMFDVNGKNINPEQKTGPSMPYCNSNISYDFVNAFSYTDRRMLQEWAQRPRVGDWPSSDLVKEVCRTLGKLVPVADKNGRYPLTEWRICFTEAELILVRSLSEFQIKMYILLKIVSKSILKPVCKDISSYAMKNIVLWLAEKHSESTFTQTTLYDRFMEAVAFLRECVLDGTLRSYMIPTRNLFESRISPHQKIELVSKIDEMLELGLDLFQSINRIGDTLRLMDTDLGDLERFSKHRDALEELLFRKNVEFKKIECEWFRLKYTVEFEDLVEKHDEYNKLDKDMQNLLVPDRDCFDTSEFVGVYKQRLKETLA